MKKKKRRRVRICRTEENGRELLGKKEVNVSYIYIYIGNIYHIFPHSHMTDRIEAGGSECLRGFLFTEGDEEPCTDTYGTSSILL